MKNGYETMRPRLIGGAAIAIALVLIGGVRAGAETKTLKSGAFSITHSVTLPGAPETIYDAITGDVRGWWDHSFSTNPRRLFLEPKAGGGFWEEFEAAGSGVKHADVIYAHRGRLLRMEGPLGLSGYAVTNVTSYSFSAKGGDSTILKVDVHCAGEYEDNWPAALDKVWHHFIVERFKPYIETGQHRK